MTPKNMAKQTQFLLYISASGSVKVNVLLQDESIWLSQAGMAELFDTTKQNIGQHLKKIFKEQELMEDSVVKNFFTTAEDGKSYQTRHYNLDAIISVGYHRKNSGRKHLPNRQCRQAPYGLNDMEKCAGWNDFKK